MPPRKDPAAVSLGRRGGAAKTPAQAAAGRVNGRRGGAVAAVEADSRGVALAVQCPASDDRGHSDGHIPLRDLRRSSMHRWECEGCGRTYTGGAVADMQRAVAKAVQG